MRTIGGFSFPDMGDQTEARIADAKAWTPDFRVCALHRQFVLLAKTRIEGAWKAYGVPVTGEIEHAFEAEQRWEEEGCPIADEEIARAAFPMFSDVPYAR